MNERYYANYGGNEHVVVLDGIYDRHRIHLNRTNSIIVIQLGAYVMCDKQCAVCECTKKISRNVWGAAKKPREFRNTPIEIKRISDFPLEKQQEWAAVKPYDKDANKGLATLAPQRMESAFKDTIRGTII